MGVMAAKVLLALLALVLTEDLECRRFVQIHALTRPRPSLCTEIIGLLWATIFTLYAVPAPFASVQHNPP
jgi:hypothetical protein